METAVAQPGPILRGLRKLREWLPEGRALPEDVWQQRHRGIRILIILQAGGLVIFGVVRGRTLWHSAAEASIVGACALLAGWQKRGRKFQAVVATYGLLVTSALLVHFANGSIEAHFHFFVMLTVIALYQDWTTFLLALSFVVVHHGLMGAISPTGVYDHASAIANPWKWALVHGTFVLASAVANLVLWRASESMRRQSEAHLASAVTADADLKGALSLLTATLESTADGILVVDNTGAIRTFNQQFVAMWHIPQAIAESGDDEQAIGFVLDQVLDPEAFLEKIREVYADTSAESFDVLRFKDGRTFERFSKPQCVGGTTVGRVWSFRDVTERKQLEDVKDNLLTAVSHEMRTPLTTVVGMALTLSRSSERISDVERQNMYERLSANASKLERMMSDMLDLDRLSRGIISPHRQPTNVADLVVRIADEQELSGEHEIHVDAQRIVTMLDPAKIERVVENLLTNAARHTPKGSHVWVKVEAEHEGLVISVDDDGPGVPDQYKVEIFEPFNQGPGRRAYSPGVGIGLSLVSRFALLHGGRAWVEDRPGGGASFKVFLPSVSELQPTGSHAA